MLSGWCEGYYNFFFLFRSSFLNAFRCLYVHLNLNMLYCQIDVTLPLNKTIHADLELGVMNDVIDWVLLFELVKQWECNFNTFQTKTDEYEEIVITGCIDQSRIGLYSWLCSSL